MGLFGVKGPKQLLASAIAGALSEFFELDERAIESNLLRDSKIVLKHAKLRPQTNYIDHDGKSLVKVHVTGVVEEVEFKWAWVLGRSDENTWMKDVTLAIRGVEFKAEMAIVRSDQRGNDDRDRGSNQSKASEPSPANYTNETVQEGKLEHYIRDQVEQIIDALTLIVTDFKFTLILPKSVESTNEDISTSGFVIGGEKLELKSKGRQKQLSDDVKQSRANMTLVQYLNIGAFHIDVINSSKDSFVHTFPLLTPISYDAVATKNGGKRFDSIGTGLTFEGRIISSSDVLDGRSDVIFHLGAAQISTMSHLASFVLAHKPTAHESRSNNYLVTKSDDADEDIIQDEVGIDRLESLKHLAMNSSVFTFPIASIAVILPNDVSITLQEFTFNYHADGTVMYLKSANGAGILIDKFPLVSTKSEDYDDINTYWMVDFIENRFSVESCDCNCDDKIEGALLKLSPAIAQSVFHGMNMIIESLPFISMDVPGDNQVSSSASSTKSAIWSVDLKHSVGVMIEREFEDNMFDSVKILLGSTSITLPLDSSTDLRFEGLTISQCSFGEMSLIIPRVHKVSGSDIITVDGGISLEIESSDVLKNMNDLMSSFALPTNKSSSNDIGAISTTTDTGDIQLLISIPSIGIKLRKEAFSLNIFDINATVSSLYCNKIAAKDATGMELSMQGVQLDIQPNSKLHISIKISEVNSLHLPNVVSLLEPISNLKLSYVQNSINLHGDKGVILLLDELKESKMTLSQQPETKSSFIQVPVAMDLSFNKIVVKRDVKESKERRTEMSLKQLRVSVKPENCGYLPLEIRLGEAKSNLFELDEMKASALVKTTNPNEVKNIDFELTNPIKVYAGHSFSDWSKIFVSVFNKRKKVEAKLNEPLQLPYVHISPMQIQVSYRFSKVSKTDTLIKTSEFNGDAETKADDLIAFYKERILNQAPGLLEDTEILGVNVAHTTVMLGSYSLGPAGALAGVCGLDAIKGALKAGKESRGGTVDEKYQFGDFVRGIGKSISNTAESGVQLRDANRSVEETPRRQKERKGNIIDYTIGASSGVKTYVDKNQAKLAGAGVATAAMVAGTILLGPVGTVAGAAIAGSLTETTYKHVQTTMKSKHSGCEDDSAHSTDMAPLSTQTSPQMILQGLLYKRRDIIKTQWQPRWAILDVENRILKNHLITRNAPASVDTNVLNFLSKPASKEASQEDLVDYEIEPHGNISLSDCKIQIDNNNLTKSNIYSFHVISGKNTWYLAATSNELRLMWIATIMDLSGQYSYEDILKIVDGR